MRNRKTSVVLGALALVLAGCGSNNEEALGELAPTPSSLPPVWSMTGLPGPADAALKPVMVVKIENSTPARPQTGLEAADTVFEEVVEAGITRFAAVYQSQMPEDIGPVRSIRHVDAAIASPIADIFVFSGGAGKTMNFVEEKLPSNISVITEGGVGMRRITQRPAPHNVYFKPADVLAGLAQTNTPTTGFFVRPSTLGTSVVASADPSASSSASSSAMALRKASVIDVHFSNIENPSWKYDATKNTYARFEKSTPFVNPEKEQLSVDYLVAIFCETMDAGYKDPGGNPVPRSVITGEGTGYVFANGTMQHITWTKEHVRDQMALFDDAGNPYELPTGRSWVSVLPRDGITKLSADLVQLPL